MERRRGWLFKHFGTLLLIMWGSPSSHEQWASSSSSSSSICEILNISIMGFFFFFKHLWNPQHFLDHGLLLLLQAFVKSSTCPRSWASSSSSIYEIFNVFSIMGFFFFKHLWNPQHFFNHGLLLLLQAFMKPSTFPQSWASSSSSICEILNISSISSSIKNLCLLLRYLYVCSHAQCSFSFTYYKCLSFEKRPTLFTLPTLLTLAHAHLRHSWNPCFWGKGKSCTSFSKDMWAVSTAANWVRVFKWFLKTIIWRSKF